jgi:superfamily II DNA or RNA helicase
MTKTKDQIQTEALDALSKVHSGTVGISMGVGKTLIGLRHMNRYYSDVLSVLIVAPKLAIFKTWKDEAEKWGLPHLLPHLTFTTYLSLNKHNPDDYDMVYLDECHSLTYAHDSWLKAFGKPIIGLTGTSPRFKMSEKGQMVNTYCPVVYVYMIKDAIRENILNNINIIVHKLQMSTAKDIQQITKKGQTFYTSEINSYDYWTNRLDASNSPKETAIFRIMRMKAMMEFPGKENYAKKLLDEANDKCILFANTQKQADKLCIHSYHSENPNSEENLLLFESGKITKLSCVLQLSEGITIPKLKEGIIMHAYGNERKSSQRMGRLLRLNPEELATVHVLCYADTIDEQWCRQALSDFDQSKIQWVDCYAITNSSLF